MEAKTGNRESPVRRRIVQNFLLVWLDQRNVDDNQHLRSIVNNAVTFTDPQRCLDLLRSIDDEKIFLIISGEIDEHVLSIIHDVNLLDSIYIFNPNYRRYESSPDNRTKVKGLFSDATLLTDALSQAVQQYEKDLSPMNFVASNEEIASNNAGFMYTQLLKEALLEVEFEDRSVKELAAYCREQYRANKKELKKIDEFEREYDRHTPIWWYTSDFCLHRMLNRALRVFDMETILTMGFFLADIHRQIIELHRKQSSNHRSSLTVYRGQGVSTDAFNQLLATKGGFISFNNFLSTSKDRRVSLQFARTALQKANAVGLLFVIIVEPKSVSTPFAHLDQVSYYQAAEQEVLFSMHTTFRIGEIQLVEQHNQRLWQVNLSLTSDHDPSIVALTKSMRDATSGATGWHRLGQLLLTVNALDKADELYRALLERTSIDNHERAHVYHMLGMIKNDQGDYRAAVSLFEQSLKIQERIQPRHELNLASTYNNIGSVYDQLHEYSQALAFQEKALAIRRRLLPPVHPDLATSFDNIGRVYAKMGDYTKALSFYEEDLSISTRSLPSNHPDLATSYNNIALVYNRMGDNTRALSYYEKALLISQQSLPPYHPDLASTYNNIASVYYQMEEYAKARSSYERALEISKRSLSPYHPNLAISYDNIGLVYYQLGDCMKALSFYEKALEVKQKSRSFERSNMATSNHLIGSVHEKMGNASKAAVFYQRALDDAQAVTSTNHGVIQLYKSDLERVKSE